jgi:hypothetical protein
MYPFRSGVIKERTLPNNEEHSTCDLRASLLAFVRAPKKTVHSSKPFKIGASQKSVHCSLFFSIYMRERDIGVGNRVRGLLEGFALTSCKLRSKHTFQKRC